jgi:hypothetical protein
MFTYEDAVLHAMAYLGAGAGAQGTGQSECRKAVRDAYRDLANEHTWSYLNTPGRIQLNAAYTDSTATFQKSGGSVPDLWTVAPGPLPSWTGYGSVRVADVIYRVDRRISDTQFTTLAPYTPAVDIAEAQSFTLYQDVYPMPADFSAAGRMLYEQNLGGMSFISIEDWQRSGKYVNQMGEPNRYTFTGDPKFLAVLSSASSPTRTRRSRSTSHTGVRSDRCDSSWSTRGRPPPPHPRRLPYREIFPCRPILSAPFSA